MGWLLTCYFCDGVILDGWTTEQWLCVLELLSLLDSGEGNGMRWIGWTYGRQDQRRGIGIGLVLDIMIAAVRKITRGTLECESGHHMCIYKPHTNRIQKYLQYNLDQRSTSYSDLT